MPRLRPKSPIKLRSHFSLNYARWKVEANQSILKLIDTQVYLQTQIEKYNFLNIFFISDVNRRMMYKLSSTTVRNKHSYSDIVRFSDSSVSLRYLYKHLLLCTTSLSVGRYDSFAGATEVGHERCWYASHMCVWHLCYLCYRRQEHFIRELLRHVFVSSSINLSSKAPFLESALLMLVSSVVDAKISWLRTRLNRCLIRVEINRLKSNDQ